MTEGMRNETTAGPINGMMLGVMIIVDQYIICFSCSWTVKSVVGPILPNWKMQECQIQGIGTLAKCFAKTLVTKNMGEKLLVNLCIVNTSKYSVLPLLLHYINHHPSSIITTHYSVIQRLLPPRTPRICCRIRNLRPQLPSINNLRTRVPSI